MTTPSQVCVSLQNNDSFRANKKRQDEHAEAVQYLDGDFRYVLGEPQLKYGTYERLETKTCLSLKWPQEVCSFVDGYAK
jgi:hypothetical protein